MIKQLIRSKNANGYFLENFYDREYLWASVKNYESSYKVLDYQINFLVEENYVKLERRLHMKLEVDELLVDLMQVTVENVINKLFLEHEKEKFYYCSLITTGEGLCPVISAWSEEALERVAKQETNMEDEIEQIIDNLKWDYEETPYFAYGEEYFEEIEEVFYKRMSKLKSESEIDREIQLRVNSMEKVLHNLDMQGIFGQGERRLGIVVNVEVVPPDFTNTQRALRLNPKEALNEWLDEVAEGLEIGNLGEFKFISSTELERMIEIKMFEEKYNIFILLKSYTKFKLSSELINNTVNLIDYLEKNNEILEENIFYYYQNEVKEMAKVEEWLDKYIPIKNSKELSKVMKLSEIQICDFEDGTCDIRMVFLCYFNKDNFILLFEKSNIDKDFKIKEIKSF